MCGISGIISKNLSPIKHLEKKISVMNTLLAHRGPDDETSWLCETESVGFGHRRLSIIDIEGGKQPMSDVYCNHIVFNGAIYNYHSLKKTLKGYPFRTNSDTEIILAGYEKWGVDVVNHLEGMFAFAIWNDREKTLFCARDRFGIKPFYFTEENNTFYFASEAKALAPFAKNLSPSTEGLIDYLHFQLYFDGKTLFQEINELPPAHTMVIRDGNMSINKYWEVFYDIDYYHTDKYFQEKLYNLITTSVESHLLSDVDVGLYVSGGIDSGIMAVLASNHFDKPLNGFHGKFSISEDYDESYYAHLLSQKNNINLKEVDISADDFISSISDVIYHLDFPIAGPGSFSQYHVSKLASKYNKVVLGGQGADEIFGGYTRYLIAYFEQCLKGAIEGTLNNGNFIVTIESIIPNLGSLEKYKPLMSSFWSNGLFDTLENRYYQLINRFTENTNEFTVPKSSYSSFNAYKNIFNGNNVGKESYFDKMTHFDFKTLLPALLHVEDRMSMAHSVESRVPFLDHKLVEFAATMPSDVKFMNGEMKRILKKTMCHLLPDEIVNRTNKMGFPVPLTEWNNSHLNHFLHDIFSSSKSSSRDFIDSKAVIEGLGKEQRFSRKLWGILSLELWMQEFLDKEHLFKKMVDF